jgi:histidinol dehydrogenase
VKNKTSKKKTRIKYKSLSYTISTEFPEEILNKALKIFREVQEKGNEALFKYTLDLERHRINKNNVKISDEELINARRMVPTEDFRVLKLAARRIKAYHRAQVQKGFRFDDGRGTVIKERLVPIDKVGICIPGGRSPLASTVLMTAIPAKIVGVGEIIMINPWPGGRMNSHVLVAAKIAGVDSIYKIGGVQGVAALACGTKSIPRVDKIVGPGSIWVTVAKAIAASWGMCGIESLAGPSEVVVVADKSADPELVAIDLLSQAEHGEDSISRLITNSDKLAGTVYEKLSDLVTEISDNRKAQNDLKKRIWFHKAKSRKEAAEHVNKIAPEHLEVMMDDPYGFIKLIKNAASIFIGPYSPVPAGDYMAGGNHVLPTGGTARWSSPLGVYDFVKRQSITALSKDALESISGPVARFAEMEGLPAHALSVKKRFKS